MRALIVLVLVLVAGAALVFAFDLFGGAESATAVTPAGPAPAEPSQSETPAQIQAPANNNRQAQETPETLADAAGIDEVSESGSNTLWGIVRDESQKPVIGATVKLSKDALMGEALAMQMILDKKPTGKFVQATTDNKGEYTFKNVAKGRDYYLTADHEDYRPIQEEMVRVADGRTQAPDLVLRPGARLVGNITDTAGNTVPQATLYLDSAFFSGNGDSPDRMTAQSGSGGEFAFANVSPGPRNLTVIAEGYGTQVVGNIMIPADAAQEETRDVVLDLGHPIHGRVVDTSGQAIVGATVTAYNHANNRTYRGEAESQDPDGRFELNDLHPGSYILSAQIQGFRLQKATRVQVGNMDVEIVMLRQACVQGRVVDSGGAPVPNFKASIRRVPRLQTDPNPSGAYEDIGLEETFTNVDGGNFRLCGLNPGNYVVMASSKGYAPTFSEQFQAAEGLDEIQVTVRMNRGGTIRGKLVAPDGSAVSGAIVTTHDDTFDTDPVGDFFTDLISTNITKRRARSSADGSFSLALLTPGEYQIRINHGSYALGKMRDIEVVEDNERDVGTITLSLGGMVNGRVYAQAGDPLDRGFVYLESVEGDLVLDSRTNAEGYFEFKHVRPGNFILSATSSSPANGNGFQQIVDQRSSQVQITVSERGEVTRDLNIGG